MLLYLCCELGIHCVYCFNVVVVVVVQRCYRCRSTKPEDGGGYVMDPALTAAITGEGIPWREAIDPASKQVYYYNDKTGETTWERPAELGPAPFATGWFGRGAAGSVASSVSVWFDLLACLLFGNLTDCWCHCGCRCTTKGMRSICANLHGSRKSL